VDERKTYQKDYLTAKNDLVEVTSLMVKNEKDLKEEKEWRQELQKVAATDKKEMEKLREELMYLQKIALVRSIQYLIVISYECSEWFYVNLLTPSLSGSLSFYPTRYIEESIVTWKYFTTLKTKIVHFKNN